MTHRVGGLALLAAALLVFTAGAAPPKQTNQLLWPDGAPGAKGDAARDKPQLIVYLPEAEKANGSAVVVCPGGGYGGLAINHEGHDIARWLTSLGTAALILDYRHAGKGYQHPAPMQDGLRAVRVARANAKEWKFDPARVGVMGFSAGGHLAATIGTRFDKGDPDAKDPIDRLSSRPDFLVLCYPVIAFDEPYTHVGSQQNLLGKTAEKKLLREMSAEKNVTADTPPVFLWSTGDDAVVPVENCVQFYLAARKAKVPAELHVYEKGRHGLGLAPNDPVVSDWVKQCERWMAKVAGKPAAKPDAKPDGPRAKKVLLIGIDGCRPDAIDAAKEATHLHALVKEGVFHDKTDVLGDRKTGADTITGPGWSAALTGVWADKHGVKDNAFKTPNFKEYPTFFRRLKETRKDAKTVALVTWLPFSDHVFSKEEDCRLVHDGDGKGYLDGDRIVAESAVKVLKDDNPDAVFVYFGNVDIVGHSAGFHPKAPRYTKELETVDGYIGRIVEAVRKRPNYAKEDWLIMVCTDHGGQGKNHSGGEKIPEIRNGFLILHGPSVDVKAGIEGTPCNVDVAVTALMHLGVPLKEEWKLDGRAVGLRK